MFLLPIDATIAAKHADQKAIGGRFGLTGVQVEFFDHAEEPTRFRVRTVSACHPARPDRF